MMTDAELADIQQRRANGMSILADAEVLYEEVMRLRMQRLREPRHILQDWVRVLPLMQQGVMMNALRGADGTAKYGSTKYLLRFYRRCVLNFAMNAPSRQWDPIVPGGGSYMGPSIIGIDDGRYDGNWEPTMEHIVQEFVQTLDALPHHFVQHLRHGIQIVGCHHPDARVRSWWRVLYLRLVSDEHLRPESDEDMNSRLSDDYEEWRRRSDDAVSH